MEKRLKILFLTPRFPFPLIGGDRLKPYMTLKHMAENHDVTLVSLNHGGYPDQNFIKELTSLGLELFPIPLDPIKASMRTIPLTLLAGQPLEIAFYNHSLFGLRVERLLKERNYDLAFCFFMRTAEFIKNKPIRKVLMAEDCRTLYQKRSYEETNNTKQKLIRWWEYRKLLNYEPKTMEMFDTVTFVTIEDIEAMKQYTTVPNYMLLTNGTDIDKFSPNIDNSKRKGILFAGKMDIWANVLMVERIAKEIMPIVWQKFPDSELTLVGANPSKSILALASDRIKIHSNVPDMTPYLQSASMFLHPHSGGSGIQNKLLEAMSCACPVITTPTGMQGIPAVDGESILLGKSNQELAANVIRLIEDKEFAGQLGRAGREVIVNNLSWEAVYRQIDNVIEATMLR